MSDTKIRLYPAIVILALQWIIMYTPTWLMPGSFEQFLAMLWGPAVGSIALLVWWSFASQAHITLRIAVCTVFVVQWGLTLLLMEPSIEWQMRFMIFLMVILRWITLVGVGVLFVFQRWSQTIQVVLASLAVVPVWGYFVLLRFEGINGGMALDSKWRWQPRAEDEYLKTLANHRLDPLRKQLTLRPGDWPGFRGAARDGKCIGTSIATDWIAHPPTPLWRQRIGPGWSSWCVVDGHLFTQEQRGKQEAVVCLQVDTGKEVWNYCYEGRFEEAAAGPGPRATPTFADGKLYTLGAAGHLACLDPQTGTAIWTRALVADEGVETPTWGFSSSPLIVEDLVVVFAGGEPTRSILAFNKKTGEPVWAGGKGKLSYSSPHVVEIGGIKHIAIVTDLGLRGFSVTGEELWNFDWPLSNIYRVVQPLDLGDGKLVLGSPFRLGSKQFTVAQNGDGWQVAEGWSTTKLAPYFNDYVTHKNKIYGFDDRFFTCVDAETGATRWRGGRYGAGQVILLADQDLLLVVSEFGQVVLLRADPAKHTELGSIQAIEGKTWNHPVVVKDKLFLRNGEEAACYRLGE